MAREHPIPELRGLPDAEQVRLMHECMRRALRYRVFWFGMCVASLLDQTGLWLCGNLPPGLLRDAAEFATHAVGGTHGRFRVRVGAPPRDPRPHRARTGERTARGDATVDARAKRPLLIVTAGLVIAVAAVAVWLLARPKPTPPPAPFTDLNAAVAELKGWEVHIPPPVPGPYRNARDSWALAGGSDTLALNKVVCNEAGIVLEELHLTSAPTFDQLVVLLETPTGRRTMAVLKRPLRGK